jgi:succinate dehydrogenase/fumarate reductase flavoprotein subunit
VFGKIAGEEAGRFARTITRDETANFILEQNLATQQERIQHFLEGKGNEDPSSIRDEMRNLMVEKAFLFREREGLEMARENLEQLKTRFRHLRPVRPYKTYNLDLISCMELEDMLELSGVILASALSREESRGSHVRLDFPKRDDAKFLKHTIARRDGVEPKLSLSNVKITRYQPEERKYRAYNRRDFPHAVAD